MQGKLFPYIKVGMTKVNLTPTVTKDERGIPHTEPNAPIYIYDTSGPFSDPNIEIDLKKGLPRLREQWIIDRNDTEQLSQVTSEYGKQRLGISDRRFDEDEESGVGIGLYRGYSNAV